MMAAAGFFALLSQKDSAESLLKYPNRILTGLHIFLIADSA